MSIPTDLIISIISYLPFADINYYLDVFNVCNKDHIIKIIHDQRIKKQIYNDETKYFIEGKLCNLYGPAVINNTEQIWYKNGLKHREDGPAYLMRESLLFWFPGCEKSSNYKRRLINGVPYIWPSWFVDDVEVDPFTD
jgi:hypothetical protein